MIEQALGDHLKAREDLAKLLAGYDGMPAIFSQEAASDMDEAWDCGPQYPRVVFEVDIQGDPARTMGGVLAVDIECKGDEQLPEDIEPVVRAAIHGYFFSSGTFTLAAQWKNSGYFTEPTNQVIGCTVTFDLLGFPIMTTNEPDVIARINEWTAAIAGLHVINYDKLPGPAWKPDGDDSAVYWRVVTEKDAWIKNRYGTIWRTAVLKCHIFSRDIATASIVARDLNVRLYAAKRLLKTDEAPIQVNRKNDIDDGADPLRTGQLTVEATYGIMVYFVPEGTINNVDVKDTSSERSLQMANKTKSKAEEVKVEEAPVEEPTVKAVEPAEESVYTASELAAHYKLFGTYREIVIVALRQAGKETATLSEAKSIIEKFKNKEVK